MRKILRVLSRWFIEIALVLLVIAGAVAGFMAMGGFERRPF